MSKKNIENIYKDLRNNMLTVSKEEDIHTSLGDDEPLRALVEFCVSGTPVTILASLDGTASIYFGTGGGFLGGGQRSEEIANLAKYLVSETREVQSAMELTVKFPLVDENQVNYYSVTRNGVYFFKGNETQAREKKCSFFKLYYLGQYIISEYRKVQIQDKDSNAE